MSLILRCSLFRATMCGARHYCNVRPRVPQLVQGSIADINAVKRSEDVRGATARTCSEC